MSHRIIIVGDCDESRALAIALSRTTGAEVAVTYYQPVPVPPQTQTLVEILQFCEPVVFVPKLQKAPAPVAATIKRSGKSEAFYARRNQLARGKR